MFVPDGSLITLLKKKCKQEFANVTSENMPQNDRNFLKLYYKVMKLGGHHFDLLTKSVASLWKHNDSPPSKKFRQTESAGKVMMIISFDYKGEIYQHAMPKKLLRMENFMFHQF